MHSFTFRVLILALFVELIKSVNKGEKQPYRNDHRNGRKDICRGGALSHVNRNEESVRALWL